MNKFFITIVILLTACQSRPVDMNNESLQIKKAWEEWEKQGKAGDPAYGLSDDIIYMLQGQPTARGKEEFKKLFANLPKIPGMSVEWKGPNIIDIAKAGDMAYSLDTLKISFPDSVGQTHNVFNHGIHLWKKNQQGQWKVSLLMVYPFKQ